MSVEVVADYSLIGIDIILLSKHIYLPDTIYICAILVNPHNVLFSHFTDMEAETESNLPKVLFCFLFHSNSIYIMLPGGILMYTDSKPKFQ